MNVKMTETTTPISARIDALPGSRRLWTVIAIMIAFILARAGTRGVFLFISGAMVIVALTIGLWGPRTRGLPVDEVTAEEGIEI